MRTDAVLLDLDGTLYVGDAPVPGGVETVRALRERGVARRYLTNTTRFPRSVLVARLRAMGFPVEERELFTPTVAAIRWLREHEIRRIALYVPRAAHEDFDSFVVTDVQPQAVVIGDLARGWDFVTLNGAFRHLVAGAQLLALQKNRYWMTEDGLSLDAGPFVAALEYAAGQRATVVGKPSAAFFELAAASLDVPTERIVVVGDDVEADVGGAQAAGLRGVLVRTGKYREEHVARSGVRPDAIINSVAELPERLMARALR
ncbi:MAG TPA: TIGR01458 family HAD-type hydrolase [Gemmatimonadaceae bacterium]|nr:TIGR01458 family HAD-type hydrolase [Gemmatimonadaceae bacterium]